MLMSHDDATVEQGTFRGAISRFWSWLRETVAGHETRPGDDAVPYVPCYYDD